MIFIGSLNYNRNITRGIKVNEYKRIFPRRNTFIAVVHVEHTAQALRNVRIALDEGADGVFLINHRIPADQLHSCFEVIRNAFPKKWIGVNWLDLSPMDGLSMMRPSMDGMWIDNASIDENSDGVNRFRWKRCVWEMNWDASFLLFGGVAFKYQGAVKDLGNAAKLAMPYVDVITTSGDGTGIAADIKKIREMKLAIGNHPLAIASGITPENAPEYMPYADCFLVATGISNSHTELNPSRVRKLAKIISK